MEHFYQSHELHVPWNNIVHTYTLECWFPTRRLLVVDREGQHYDMCRSISDDLFFWRIGSWCVVSVAYRG